MGSVFLDKRTARDIDVRVEKILSDLGSPPPPLVLDDVRALLALDRAYYSSSDEGVLTETIHYLRLAGKQVIRQPWRLLEVVKKMDLKAFWVPERKQILLDQDLPSTKQRWAEGHEVGHGILPWHEAVLHGDQLRTLSPGCAWAIEEEANYAAGRLLFLRDRFGEELRGGTFDLERLRALARTFKNSITSTLWRAVEEADFPAFALVSQHPNAAQGEKPVRHYIRSRAFADRFSGVSAMDVFRAAASYCRNGNGPLGRADLAFNDVNQASHEFALETFHNTHESLTLGVHVRERTRLTVPAEAYPSRAAR